MQEVSRSYDQADENARQVVRRTRNVTRRKYTPEEKVRIVIEGIRGEISVSALCRREGINPGVYYKWLKAYMEAGKSRLKGDTLREANKAEVDALKRENERLKELVAQLSVENLVLKKGELYTILAKRREGAMDLAEQGCALPRRLRNILVVRHRSHQTN